MVFICLSLFNFALKFEVMDLTWGEMGRGM